MTNEEFKAKKELEAGIRQRDRFACAALTGLLQSDHFEPGGKRKLDAMGEITLENLAEGVKSMAPTVEDLEEYFDAITTVAWDVADIMMEKRG